MCPNLLIQNTVTPASQSLSESKSSLNLFLIILCCLSGQETYLYASVVPITDGAEEQGEFTSVPLNLDYLCIFSAASPHTLK